MCLIPASPVRMRTAVNGGDLCVYRISRMCAQFSRDGPGDRKYRVTRPDGSLCLLRTASADQYERKKAEYEWMERVASLGVPICRPLEFGRCGEGVYTLFSWVEGEDCRAGNPPPV